MPPAAIFLRRMRFADDIAVSVAEQTAEKASEALSLFGRDLTGEREQAGFGFLCEMIRFIKDRKN